MSNLGKKKPLPKLTRKQAAFVKEIIENPTISNTEAAARAYNTDNRNLASTIANQNMNKYAILSHLSDANDMVEKVLQGTVSDWGTSEKVAERALATETAKYIHDKVHGKATQKIEQTTTKLTLSIDMTQPSLPDGVVEGEVVE